MLLSNQFPVNYFSISEVEQSFPDFEARRRQQSTQNRPICQTANSYPAQMRMPPGDADADTVQLHFQDTYSEDGKLPGDSSYWRFNKIHNYGSKDEDTSFSTVRAPGVPRG